MKERIHRLQKAFLSTVLSAAMVVGSIQPAVYAAAPEEVVTEQLTEEKTKDTLRDMVSDEAYPNGLIEFGQTLYEIKEGGEDIITVVREGNTDNSADVTFKAVDVSAKYGKDYTLSVREGSGRDKERELEGNPDTRPLVMDDAEVLPEDAGDIEVEQTIEESAEEAVAEDAAEESTEEAVAEDAAEESVEQTAAGEEVVSSLDGEESDEADDPITEPEREKAEEPVSAAESDAEEEPVRDEVAEEPVAEEESPEETVVEEDAAEEKVTEKTIPARNTGLANAYYMQNGETAPVRDWRQYSDDEVEPEIKEAMDKGEEQSIAAMKDVEGVVYRVNFAPGEYKKEIAVKVNKDGVSESDEVIAFLLYDEEGAELGSNYHGYVNIKDIDEKQDNIFSMKESRVRVLPGESYAKVSIVRTGGTEQMAMVNVGTKGVTAKSGEDYESFNTDLFFAPGITERELQIPIKGDRAEKRTFYVGIKSNSEKVIEKKNATLVTIEPLAVVSGENEPEEALDGASDAADTAAEESDTRLTIEENADGDKTYSYYYADYTHQNGKDSRRSYWIAGDNVSHQGIDISGAKSVTIKFTMNGDTWYPWPFSNARGKKATVRLESGNGKYQEITRTTSNDNDSFTVTFNNNGWSDYKKAFISIETWGTGCMKNANTWLNIKDKMEVTYSTVKFNLQNGNAENKYTEKTYTQQKEYSTHDSFFLGTASFDASKSDVDSKSFDVGNALNIYYHFANKPNSANILPSAENIEIKGYKIKKNTGNNKWSDELIKSGTIIDTAWVNSHAKDYRQSDDSFILAPVCGPKRVKVTFQNTDSKKGNYKGYSDNESFEMNCLDTLDISSATKSGYAVKAIQMDYGNYTASSINLADKNRLVAGFGGKYNKTATVNLIYDTTHLRVLADPLFKGKDSVKLGKVFYADDENKKTWIGDWQNIIDVQGVNMYKTYNLVGMTELEKDASGQSGASKYRVVWRDGTLDDDEDGVMSEDPSYTSFKVSRGNVLPYIMKRTTGRVYYNFEPKAEAGNPADIEGFLNLQDEYLISGKKTERGLNKAQVVVDYNEGTTAHGQSHDKRLSGDGYFRIASNEFSPYNVYLVNISYDGPEGSINVGAPIYPADCTNVVVKAQDDMPIKDVTLYKHTKEWKTLTQEADKWEVVTPTGFYDGYFIDFTVGTDKTNTDEDKAYRVEMTADKSGVETTEGVLQFYDGDSPIGDPVKGEPIAKGLGRFRFEFKPDAMKLKPGVTARVKFTDGQGHEYLERELGLKLSQEVGTLTLLNEFAMNCGVNIDFLSNVDSRFFMGWAGSFDEFQTASDDSGDKILTIGIGKQIAEKTKDNKKTKLQEAAEKLIEADEDIGAKNQALKKAEEAKNAQGAGEKEKKAYKEAKEAYDKAKSDRIEKADKYDEEADKTQENGPEKKSTKIGGKLEIALGVRLVLTYAFDGEKSMYYFKSMMITAKLTVKGSVDIKFQLPWGFTINIGIEAGGDIGASFIVRERTDDEIKAKEARQYAGGGDKDKLDYFIWKSKDFEREGNLNIAPYITLKVGAGALFGALEANISGTAAFDFNFYTGDTDHTGTVKLSATVTAKVIFVFTYEKQIAEKTFPLFGVDDEGDNALEGAFEEALSELQNDNALNESLGMLDKVDFSYMKNGSKWKSTHRINEELEKSARGEEGADRSLDEDPEVYAEASIADKIVENPEFDMAPLSTGSNGNNRFVAVFTSVPADRVDDQDHKENERAAYYTVYNNGWSTPALIDDDGTLDMDTRVFSLGDRGALMVWSSVDEEYAKNTPINKRQMAMNLKCRIISEIGNVSKPMYITKNTIDTAAVSANSVSPDSLPDLSDFTCDVAANVAYNDDGFVVFYEKKEYKDSETALGDVIYPEIDVFAARTFKFRKTGSDNPFDGTWDEGTSDQDVNEAKTYITERFKERYNLTDEQINERTETYVKCFYGQKFFEYLPKISLEEEIYTPADLEAAEDVSNAPQVGYWKEGTEATVHTLSSNNAVILDSDAISYNNLGLFAYTLDWDSDLENYNDREILMQMYDFEHDGFMYPIAITADADEDCNVRFARTGKGDNAITWLCYLSDGDVVALNVSNLIQNADTLLKGGTPEQPYYYINKTLPASSSDSEKKNHPAYQPEIVLVEGQKGEIDDSVDQTSKIASNISAFDVASSEDCMYVVWSQTSTGVKKGIDEDSYEATLPENAANEEQLYTMRFSADGELTYPVQITSKQGAHYKYPAFGVTSDGGMVGLSYRAMDRTITLEEHNEGIRAYNAKIDENNAFVNVGGADVPEKQKEVTEEEFVPYTVADVEKGVPMAFEVNPKGRVKIKDETFTQAEAGSTAGFEFDILNDGFEMRNNLVVKAVDAAGKSVLMDPSLDAEDAESAVVNSISVNSLIGGERVTFRGVMRLPEDATVAEAFLTVEDETGRVLASGAVTKDLFSYLEVDDLKAENTGTRNEYRVTGKVINTGTAKSDDDNVDIGIYRGDEWKGLAGVRVEELLPGQYVYFDEVITVEDGDFVSETAEDGAVTEKLDVFAGIDGNESVAEVERVAYGSEMARIKAIKDVTIDGCDSIDVAAGEAVHVVPEFDSTRSNGDGDGSEGLQYFFVSAGDGGNFDVKEGGTIIGRREGTGKVDMYVLPADRSFVATGIDGALQGVLGEHEGIYNEVASQAIYKKTFEVNVTPDPEDDANAQKFNDRKGVSYKVVSGNQVVVTGINPVFKAVKKVKIPAQIKVGKDKYKVVGIAPRAFENNTDITSVTIGKYVEKIDKRAFAGCTALKKVKFGRALTYIGERAFTGCTSLKAIKLSKNVTALGRNAFEGCSAVKRITLNKKLIDIGDKAFSGCSSVKKLVITKAVRYIGISAFEGMTALKKLYIRAAGLEYIGLNAFKEVPANIKVRVKVKKALKEAIIKLLTPDVGIAQGTNVK